MAVSVFEVRYDDSEVYHVAGRFSMQAAAQRLRDRLAARHLELDADDCAGMDADWTVVEVHVDVLDPEVEIPVSVFDVDQDGHANPDGVTILDLYGDAQPGAA